MNNKESRSKRRRRQRSRQKANNSGNDNKRRRSRNKSKNNGHPNNPQRSPTLSYDSDSEDEYLRDGLEKDVDGQRRGIVDFGPIQHGAEEEDYHRFSGPGFMEAHQHNDRFTRELSGVRAQALTSMVENQMERARINILKKGVPDHRHHLDTASERIHSGQRDRSPLDSRSQRHHSIEAARNDRRREMESNVVQMRHNLEIAQGRLQEAQNEMFESRINRGYQNVDSHPPIGREILFVEPQFQQDVDEESDQTFEQEFDEEIDQPFEQEYNDDSDQTSDEDSIRRYHPAFQQGFVETDPRYDLNLDEVTDESDAMDFDPEDLQAMVYQTKNVQNFEGIEPSSASFAQSNRCRLQPAMSRSILPHVSNHLQFSLDSSEFPLTQSFGQIQNDPKVDENAQMSSNFSALPLGTSMPVVGSMTLPNMITLPQMSKIGELQNLQERPNISRNLQRPEMVGNFQTPDISSTFPDHTPGISPSPNIAGVLPRLSNTMVPPPTNISGMLPRPQNTMVPPPTNISGLLPRPQSTMIPPPTNISGILPRPSNTMVPPPTNISGMLPRPQNTVVPQPTSIAGILPRPQHTMVPPPTNNSGMLPRPHNTMMPQPPNIPGMLPRPDGTGIPKGLQSTNERHKYYPAQNKDSRKRPSRFSDMAQNQKSTGERKLGNSKKKKKTLTTETFVRFEASMECPVCPDSPSFQNEVKFRDHWWMFHIKNNKLHYCPVCGTVSNSALTLQDHYRKRHNEGSEELSVNTLQKLCLAKKVTVNNPLFRDPALYVYGNKEEEKKSVVFSKGLKCPVCPTSKSFDEVKAFHEHWQNFHTKFTQKLSCPSTGCSSFTFSLEVLKKHYWEEHNYGNDELTKATVETLQPTCKVVPNDLFINPGKAIFPDCKPLEIEFQIDMTCPICNTGSSEKLQTLREYQFHWQKYHVKYCDVLVCPVSGCDTHVINQDELKLHLDRHHDPHQIPQVSSARKEMKLNEHYQDPGNCMFTTLEVENGIKFSFEEGMTCPGCSDPKAFETEEEFSIHWNIHMEYVNEYTCPFPGCKKKEYSVPKLNLHISKAHTCSTGQEWKLEVVDNLPPVRIENPRFVDPGPYKYVQAELPISSGNGQGQKVKIVFREGFHCPVCKTKKRFQKVEDFRNHWICLHSKQLRVEQYFCPVKKCRRHFYIYENFVGHYKKEHSTLEKGDNDFDLILEVVPLQQMGKTNLLP